MLAGGKKYYLFLNSNIEIHKSHRGRGMNNRTPFLNSNIEIHKSALGDIKFIPITVLNSNIEIHKLIH